MILRLALPCLHGIVLSRPGCIKLSLHVSTSILIQGYPENRSLSSQVVALCWTPRHCRCIMSYRVFAYPWLLLVLFMFQSTPAYTVLVNYTVDDAGLDTRTGMATWTYRPDWNFGPECTRRHYCANHLNTSQLVNGTWHANTYSPNTTSMDDIHSAFVDFVGESLDRNML